MNCYRPLFVTVLSLALSAQTPEAIQAAQHYMQDKHTLWLKQHRSLLAKYNAFSSTEDCRADGYRIPSNLFNAKEALRIKVSASDSYYTKLSASYSHELEIARYDESAAAGRIAAARQNIESIDLEISEIQLNIGALESQGVTGAAATAREILEILNGQRRSAVTTISMSNDADAWRVDMRGQITNLRVLISSSNRSAQIMNDRYLSEYDMISAFYRDKCRIAVP